MEPFSGLTESEVDHLVTMLDEISTSPPGERAHRLAEVKRAAPNVYSALVDLLRVPTAIDPAEFVDYEHLVLRGGGGTCSVYKARSKRLGVWVALKVSNRPLPGVQQAFRREREALLALQDRSIARILDAGRLTDGRSYIATQWIEGPTLGEAISQWQANPEQAPSQDERLALFGLICRGVATAHEKGRLHLDLKPDNVILRGEGPHADPQIIDFGAAELMQASPVRMATPAYASREQWRAMRAGRSEASEDYATTRMDVFSLGVILFELATGDRPFPHHEHLEGRSIGADRLATMTQIDRRTAHIVAVALSPDPAARHASAKELSRDVDLVLAGEFPFQYRPTPLEWASAQWERHRVIAASLLVAGLVAVVAVGALGTAQQREAALRSRDEAWFGAVVDAFPRAGTAQEMIASSRAIDFMLQHAGQIDARFAGDPQRAQALHKLCGRAFLDLGDFDRAQFHFERSAAIADRVYGPDSPEAMGATHDLGEVARQEGRLAEAERLFTRALQGRQRANAPPVEVLGSKTGLAAVLIMLGTPEEAEPRLEEVIRGWQDLLDSPQDISTSQRAAWRAEQLVAESDLLAAIQTQGPARFVELLERYPVLLAAAEEVWGEEGPRTIIIANNYFKLLVESARPGDVAQLEAAAELGAVLLDRIAESHGEDHAIALLVLHNLGVVKSRLGDPEAEAFYRKALGWRQKVLGLDHADTLHTVQSLAAWLREAGRRDEAMVLLDESLRAIEGRDPDLIQFMLRSTLGELLFAAGSEPEGLVELRQAVAEWRAIGSPRTPHGGVALLRLAEALETTGDHVSALAAMTEGRFLVDVLPVGNPMIERFDGLHKRLKADEDRN